MQSEDGGWAAFDVDNNWAVLNQVPFADHNAMLDPTCPDITGRVLECLCRRGMAGHEAVRRGVAYLFGAQEKDGSWYGRWGVNYIYGSFLAMRAWRPAARRKPKGRHRQSRKVVARHPESRRRLGRILRQLRPRGLRSRAELPLADRVGRSRAAAPPATARAPPSAAASSSCLIASGPTAHGPSKPPPAPDSPMSSTSPTACTATTSRCWRWHRRKGKAIWPSEVFADCGRAFGRAVGRLPFSTR